MKKLLKGKCIRGRYVSSYWYIICKTTGIIEQQYCDEINDFLIMDNLMQRLQ